MIIGFAGKAGAGKSTAADCLQQEGFVRDAYAAKIKKAVSEIFCIPMETLLGDRTIKEQIDPYWGMSSRKIMQLFGTEACRRVFGEALWERVLWRRWTDLKLSEYNLVIDDIRYPNEARAILDRGGRIIEIVRPGADHGDTHSSEQPLPDELVSIRLANDGTVWDLHEAVLDLCFFK